MESGKNRDIATMKKTRMTVNRALEGLETAHPHCCSRIHDDIGVQSHSIAGIHSGKDDTVGEDSAGDEDLVGAMQPGAAPLSETTPAPLSETTPCCNHCFADHGGTHTD
jgi:hypothetical protein